MTSEESFASGFGNRVRPVFRFRAFATERGEETLVFARFFKEGENVKCISAEHVCAAYSGDTFHCAIPDRVAARPIKREYAVDAGVEQSGEKKILLAMVQVWSGKRRRMRVLGGVLIVAHPE